MMGQLPPAQNALFYDICLEQYVPQNHLLRQIDQVLDLSQLRNHLSDYYSDTGRPSVDPELLIRMLIVGYCFGIRSERRLCEEVHLNLAYRWFCRLGLEDEIPSHSTFSKNRHGRFRESETLRYVFEEVVRRCMTEGLVAGEGFAIDASVIKADANRQRGLPGSDVIDWGDPESQSRPVREYLEALDKDGQLGATPKNVSLTDPQARWTAASGGPAFYAYSTNYLIDIKNNIIVDTDPTPAGRIEEIGSTRTMINRVEERFGLKPQRLIGDTAYGTAAILGWIVETKQIEPHTPVWGKANCADGVFSRADFTWQADNDRYLCPGGKSLQRYRRNFKKPRTGITKEDTIIYRATKHDCEACEHKPRCCPKAPQRKVTRSIYESSRDVARAIAKTDAYKQSRKDRKKVEMLFAHLKRILKLDRLRLRGLSGANDEFLLAATTQNLRRMAKLLIRPPPDHRIGAPA